MDSINFDIQTDSSLNGFETVDKLVIYKGVMCFINPIPVFTPFGYIYKVKPLAKVAHYTKLFIYIWKANFKGLFLFVILKQVTLYSFVPDHSSFNMKLESKLLEQRILINNCWHRLILNLNISNSVVIHLRYPFGSEREICSGSAI